MIRINLAPSRVRSPRAAGRAAPTGNGPLWILGMVIGWSLVGLAGYWLVTLETEAEQDLRRKASETNRKIEAIKAEIDEETLEREQLLAEQLDIAIKKVSAKKKTPVYVLYELAMILTPTNEGGGPDKDEEKYRQQVRRDPQSKLNDRWDPSGLWLESLVESDDVLTLTGSARDAADLTEFTRRLRASARFGELSNPDFQRVTSGATRDDHRYLNWRLTVQVRRWD